MTPLKQNENKIKNMETPKVPVDNKLNQNDSFKLEKEDVLKNLKGFEDFKKRLNIDPKYRKEEILQILEKVDEMDLQMYLDSNVDDGNLVNFKVNDFINNFKGLIVEKKEEKKIDLMINSDDAKKESKVEKIETGKEKIETGKEKNNNKQEALKTLNQKLPKLKELFKGDSEIENILNQIEANKEKPDEVLRLVNELLSTKEKATKFFDKVAATGDKELYESTYKSFENLGVSIPPYIPREIYEIKKDETLVDPRFPDAPEGKVEKRGDLVTYGDKTIDERTGKAYIISDNGYRLETSLNVPNLTEMKVEYQEKRLELLEIIDTDKKILKLLEDKEEIKKKISILEQELGKTGIIGENTEKNTLLTPLKDEIKRIDEKLSQAVPNYNEKQDKTLKSFLEKSIEEKTNTLKKLEEKYKKDISDLYEKSADNVRENDEKTRQTTLLLDSIGFTLIPQHITDEIIASINKNPEHYGFESRIDLKNGNFGGINTIATKERFIKKFNKMISGKEGEPITKDEIDNILVKKLERDKDSQEEKNKELINKFSTYNIMSDLGTWDREKLENNLNIKEKENPQTEK